MMGVQTHALRILDIHVLDKDLALALLSAMTG